MPERSSVVGSEKRPIQNRARPSDKATCDTPNYSAPRVIGGWLFRVVVAFAVAGAVLYDAGSIAVNFFTLDSKADEIALSIATAVTNEELPDMNPRAISDEATMQARDAEAKLMRAKLDSEGVLSIRLRRVATTLVVGRIGWLEDWTKATADAQAGTS
jgi:hypothetical protein